VELTWWQAYLINLGYIFACMLINMLGMSTMGHFSKMFSAIALLPFVIFFAAGFASPSFTPDNWLITTREGRLFGSSSLSVFFHDKCD